MLSAPETEGALAKIPRPINRVVIVRATRLGDFMCAVPTLRALRLALPNSEITLIALPFAHDLVKRYPYLDRFEEFPGYPGMRETPFDALRTLTFLARQQRRNYDLAIQLHGSGVFSNPFTLMLGARVTVGFTRPEDHGLGLDHWVVYPDRGHEIDRVLLMARLLGAPDAGSHLEFPLLDHDRTSALRLARTCNLDLSRPIIGVHPGAKNPTRRWPAERFAAAALRLAEQIGAQIVVTGGQGEERECAAVQEIIGSRARSLNGQTSIGSLAALLERMALFLTNDTGPAHIAYALGVRSVTIFGAAEPDVWGPLDTVHHKPVFVPIDCRPCGLTTCQNGYRCLTEVSLDQVVAAAEAALQAE